jgi:hypothetical protein
MKKLVLTSVCALAVSGAAFAQGLVNWSTAPGANILVQTNGTVYSSLFGGGPAPLAQGSTAGTVAAGTAYYYTLLYGSQNTTGIQVADPSSISALISGWNTTALYATNTGSGGRIQYINPNLAAAVPWGGNTDAGGLSNNIVLVGWSQNIGALGTGLETWQNVSNVLANWSTLGTGVSGNAFFGMSATGFLVGNDSPAAGANWQNGTFGAQTANGLPITALSGNAIQLYMLPVPEPATMALVGLGGLSLLLFRRQRK